MKKRVRLLIAALIIFTLVFSSALVFGKTVFDSLLLKETAFNVSVRPEDASAVTLKEGDSVLFGTYLGEDIRWSVLRKESDGKLLLMTDYAVCLKAFDACGEDSDFHDGADKTAFGSSEWEKSTIRQWLNSKETTVIYSHCPPEKSGIYKGFNAYADEGGFLCDENFSEPLYEMISDSGVFLPTEKQLKMLFKAGDRVRRCTKSALIQNDAPYIISSSRCVWYWTSSPIKANRSSVCTVTSSGGFYKALAYDGTVGVCPALYLKSADILTKGGNGSAEEPYLICGGGERN